MSMNEEANKTEEMDSSFPEQPVAEETPAAEETPVTEETSGTEGTPAAEETKKPSAILKWWKDVEAWWEAKPVRKNIWQFLKMFIISNGVTIFQYLFMTFTVPLFDLLGVTTDPLVIPAVDITLFGVSYQWGIIGEYAGSGFASWCATTTAIALAQCINFPLQRNISFKSKGNIPWQIMWYAIGWVAITLIMGAINNLWLPLADALMPAAVYNILKTVVIGGISIAVFFPIFKIIFPEGEKKKKEEEKTEEVQAE